MKKHLLAVILAAVAGSAVATEQAVIDRYAKTCVICHANGTANAPKTGSADWQPRLNKGMDVLVQSVNKGLNAMPPKGMCFDCSADEIKKLIEYMATPQ